jgi:PAS domain-containing protein
MITTIQKATHDLISRTIKDVLNRDRRNYGLDIRLWNDRDPRVDQSFFQGSVPGFVLGVDQTIVDWNVGFELIFGANPLVKRGINISKWYELIENFRRLPNREEKLHGEAMLPITDRERVVYISPDYGRIVFVKIMSPVLDRFSGRIIGWNIALNINSVHERVKFFTDLNDRIQGNSKHARHVIGIDQIASKSKVFHDAVQTAISDIGMMNEVLFLGSLGAAPFIEEVLTLNPSAKVHVMDNDTEALRHLRHKLSRYGQRVKIVRRALTDLSIVPEGRFDAAIILWPAVTSVELDQKMDELEGKLGENGKISIISWIGENGSHKFWDLVTRDLEERGEVDVIRWHLGLIKEESARLPTLKLDAGNLVARGLARVTYGLSAVRRKIS